MEVLGTVLLWMAVGPDTGEWMVVGYPVAIPSDLPLANSWSTLVVEALWMEVVHLERIEKGAVPLLADDEVECPRHLRPVLDWKAEAVTATPSLPKHRRVGVRGWVLQAPMVYDEHPGPLRPKDWTRQLIMVLVLLGVV